MPKENLSDHPSAYDPKILRKQVRGPRLHSTNINYVHIRLQSIQNVSPSFCVLLSLLFTWIRIISQLSSALGQQSTFEWANLFNVYYCPILFVPFTSRRNSISSEACLRL